MRHLYSANALQKSLTGHEPAGGCEVYVDDSDDKCNIALRLALKKIRDSIAGHQHVDCNRCDLCKIIRICDDAISQYSKGTP